MNKIILIAVVLTVAWYGSLYRQNDIPFIQNSTATLISSEQVKCITKDGRVLYGSVPKGVLCERLEPIKGSLTILTLDHSNRLNINKNNNYRSSTFKCDGRQHCSQMKSRAEAVFFIRNCPNTKMDGDHDGEPCEDYF